MSGGCVSCKTPLPEAARYCSTCGSDQTGPGGGPRDATSELQGRLARTLAGRYEIRGLLGAGGMAAVFLADDLTLEREVAIKVLPPELARDLKVVARFQREAKTAAKLDHPHIIPIHRVESEAGLEYFVMKYVRGRSLDDVLGGGALPVEFAVRVLREAAEALGHAHQHGVVHRDVKPANIMLDAGDRVVLTDFGISKAGDTSQLTHTGVIVGTPYYMAPEQALGQTVDGRADQYALGIVGWQLLTGRTPFDGESAHTIIYKHIHEQAPALRPLRADAPPHLVSAIMRAMAKKPEGRWPSMEAFAAALMGRAVPDRVASTGSGRTERSDAGGSQRTMPMPVASEARTIPLRSAEMSAPRRRRAALWAVLALIVVGGAATAAVWRPRAQDIAAAPATTASLDTAAADSASRAVAPAVPTVSDSTPAQPPSPARVDSTGDGPEFVTLPETPGRGRVGRRTSPRTSAREPSREPAIRIAPLTVASEPYGTLYVDGLEIGDTPVANYALAVGRTYQVRVEREGYRTKRETITVSGPNPIRRRYILDPGDSR